MGPLTLYSQEADNLGEVKGRLVYIDKFLPLTQRLTYFTCIGSPVEIGSFLGHARQRCYYPPMRSLYEVRIVSTPEGGLQKSSALWH